ncbi:hypothetical protein [Anthocerotibacter panamensis]|uniref:hypothetical protein n=1 Tax=Anthocerotibacter panamensis TaxID=2857077 RepID=UPI001C405115|nr:hypothetical protein [Anthocerotibacter panamensis]
MNLILLKILTPEVQRKIKSSMYRFNYLRPLLAYDELPQYLLIATFLVFKQNPALVQASTEEASAQIFKKLCPLLQNTGQAGLGAGLARKRSCFWRDNILHVEEKWLDPAGEDLPLDRLANSDAEQRMRERLEELFQADADLRNGLQGLKKPSFLTLIKRSGKLKAELRYFAGELDSPAEATHAYLRALMSIWSSNPTGSGFL